MSNVQLLDKTRKINKFLHNVNSDKVVLSDICTVFCDILGSDVLLLGSDGKVLGSGTVAGIAELKELLSSNIGSYVDAGFNERLLSVLSTKENVNLETLGFAYGTGGYKALITPVDIAGERLGTVFTYKTGSDYGIDDIILCEYGAAVIGLEMMRDKGEESALRERNAQAARDAAGALSDSEGRALLLLLENLPDGEGTLVTSRIADEAGMTRSVIVNTVKKLDGAGIFEARSAGMKGTRIRVVNNAIYEEAENLKRGKIPG